MRTLYQYIVVRTQSGFFIQLLAHLLLPTWLFRPWQEPSSEANKGQGRWEVALESWKVFGPCLALCCFLNFLCFLFFFLFLVLPVCFVLSTVTQDLVADLFPTQPLLRAPPQNLLGKKVSSLLWRRKTKR